MIIREKSSPDPLNRLAGATYSSGVMYTYSYDKAGNRRSMASASELLMKKSGMPDWFG